MTSALPVNDSDQTELRFLIEKNADGILVVDQDGIVLFANPASAQIFGRPQRALVGSPVGIPLVSGETTEITIHRPGGGQIDAEIRVVEARWGDRQARLASIRDVSARKLVEEHIRHSTKMEAIGRLTAGIAHDFNNLLTVVLGNLEHAQRQARDDDLQRLLENATRGARRAAVLTERLLSFSRRKPLEPRVLNVNDLVSGMSDLLRRTLGERIAVRTSLADDVWNVEVDPTELEAAIVNLAVNARDAMPAGGEVIIETANVELDAAYAAVDIEVTAGCYVLVSVTDTGTGMLPDVLKHVFEPFFTTKADGRGTGLGLSQVYGFVKQSNGHVKLYSEVGVGTTAKIYLPRATIEGAAVQPPEGQEVNRALPRSRPGEAILVVEDDEDVRSYTVSSLRELGYAVSEAGDARAALQVLQNEPSIRLMVTDLGLPGGMDGRALAARAQEVLPGLKILITTAYAGAGLIHEGRLDRGVNLLSKPFTLTALAKRTRELLDDGVRQPPCVLVVDDEPLIRMLIVETLEGANWHVEEAGSFAEAMQKIEALSDKLAAAVVDLGLPDRPGDDLVSQIRGRAPNIPILLATGFGDDEIRRRLAADEHIRVLQKPFDPERLIAALRDFGV